MEYFSTPSARNVSLSVAPFTSPEAGQHLQTVHEREAATSLAGVYARAKSRGRDLLA